MMDRPLFGGPLSETFSSLMAEKGRHQMKDRPLFEGPLSETFSSLESEFSSLMLLFFRKIFFLLEIDALCIRRSLGQICLTF
jgi:hypothetical protein